MKEGAKIFLTGIVQGVGFRPFVYSLARRLDLNGWVRNTSYGVDIVIEGESKLLAAFTHALTHEFPSLAHIDSVEIKSVSPNGYDTFEIIHSEVVPDAFQPVSPDICICEDCLRELFDPYDRRYHYPFINCTNCGPRFTIIKDVPYDRSLTTMAQFQMCPDCLQEYQDPSNRRFHAQPVACPNCGPAVWLEEKEQGSGILLRSEPIAVLQQTEVIMNAQRLIADGKIIAIKGLGGFHLACDATNVEAVRELRRRKLRVDKPFALMMADMETIQTHCFVDVDEARLLKSKERPIVILQRKPHSNIAEEVAPHQSSLGVMLPYTPLHYLLYSDLNSALGTNKNHIPKALVMTSGNISEEPIAYENDEARIRLASLSDAFLMHNRDIHTRCDDSVVRVFHTKDNNDPVEEQFGDVSPNRRSRGYAPFPVHLNLDAPPILAVGAELKNTFCLTRKNYAFISQHIGDVENYETFRSFEDGISHFERLFRIHPALIAHDLHPNYLTTRYALERTKSEGIQVIGVQHHHAHIAACMAEHNLPPDQEVFGVAFDGTGYGDDGAIWGGEFFLAGYKRYQRYAHLGYMPIPGGDAGIRNPARVSLAYLWQLGIDWDQSLGAYNTLCDEERTILRSQLEQRINTPLTSSMGRLFDAVSSLVGIRQKVNYEAQAAIELEASVDQNEEGFYPIEIDSQTKHLPHQIQIKPFLESVVNDVTSCIPTPLISARFHNTIARLVVEVMMAMRNSHGNLPVVLSGGVWQNMVLLSKTIHLLLDKNFQVYIHRKVPTNDGGLALGQALVAIYQVNR